MCGVCRRVCGVRGQGKVEDQVCVCSALPCNPGHPHAEPWPADVGSHSSLFTPMAVLQLHSYASLLWLFLCGRRNSLWLFLLFLLRLFLCCSFTLMAVCGCMWYVAKEDT
eukprot:352915-Chlamydomonas_euryale.AAC.6